MLLDNRPSNLVFNFSFDGNCRQRSSNLLYEHQVLKTPSVGGRTKSRHLKVLRSRQHCEFVLQEGTRSNRASLLAGVLGVRSIVCSSSNDTMRVSTLEEIFSSSDGKAKKAVLLDQFGVLHDGQKAYPGAVQAVEYLHGLGSDDGAKAKLEKLGFDIRLFDGVITSGEVTHGCLEDRASSFWKERKSCIHFTWLERGSISLQNLGIDVTTDPQKADCIIAHGTEALGTQVNGQNASPCSVEQMKEILSRCQEIAKQKGSPMPLIVANPDVVTVNGDELIIMPGTLAKFYEDIGGQVHRMGKPDPIIYDKALEMLGLHPEDVIAIGDSLEHDIFGAQSMNIDSIFIAAGIHKKEVVVGSNRDTEMVKEDSLDQIFEAYRCRPQYTLLYFETKS